MVTRLILPALCLVLVLPAGSRGQVEDLTGGAGGLSSAIDRALGQAERLQPQIRFYIAFAFEGLVPSDAHAGGAGSMIITRSDGWMTTGLGGIMSVTDAWNRPGADEQVLDLATMSMTAPAPDPVLERRELLCLLSGRTGGREGTAISDLSIRLPEGRMGMHERTLYWLGDIPDGDLTGWIEERMTSLDHRRDSGLREELIGLLSLLPEGNDVIASLVRYASEDEDEDVRHRAITSLGRRPENTSPRLATIFGDAEDQTDRIRALQALAGREGPASRQLLTITVEDTGESEGVRRTALAYLNRFEDREMDALLEQLLADEEPAFRRRLVAIWEQREPRRAVPLLEQVALNDPEDRVREAAVSSLGDISDPLAAEALATVFRRSEHERIRMAALRQRVSLMESDREKITWLNGLARDDESFEVRKEAVRLLGRIDDPAALEALRRLLDNGRHDLRQPR